MKRYLNILFVLCSVVSLATHNRAGEITYRQINDLSYEIIGDLIIDDRNDNPVIEEDYDQELKQLFI